MIIVSLNKIKGHAVNDIIYFTLFGGSGSYHRIDILDNRDDFSSKYYYTAHSWAIVRTGIALGIDLCFGPF